MKPKSESGHNLNQSLYSIFYEMMLRSKIISYVAPDSHENYSKSSSRY